MALRVKIFVIFCKKLKESDKKEKKTGKRRTQDTELRLRNSKYGLKSALICVHQRLIPVFLIISQGK